MAFDWEEWPTEELLDLRLCELGVTLEGSWLTEPIARAQAELLEREILLRPHFWLADEWFSPDGVPGVAIPFYLAHPRLSRLERQMMFEVEGGARADFLRLCRHELGHAVMTGFRLHRRRRFQQLFGRASAPYPDHYRPKPWSRRYVHHLDGWYAQSHPTEDFAETFAVWLTPRSGWRKVYESWPALEKLEWVDEVMTELRGEAPQVKSRARPYSLGSLRDTLREHYRKRQQHYRPGYTEQYDQELLRVFDGTRPDAMSAAAFIRRHRREIRELVSQGTGEYEFAVDQVLKEMLGRVKELRLRVGRSERRTKLDFAIALTVHTVHTLHRGNEWHPM